MVKIIARKREQEELQRLYENGRAEFTVVYGRRRVGKTFLIREYFKDRFAFSHTALSPYEDAEPERLLEQQLTNFHSSLLKYGSAEGLPPKTWIEAFDRLIRLLERKSRKERCVVFIDELPWLDTQKSGFLPAFEHFWNGWGAGRDSLLLIVCGSSTSWIADKLMNNTGGLYNRTTSALRLRALNLAECAEFFQKRGIELNTYDLIQYYMIMGGIPYYMDLVHKGEDLSAGIDRIFFDRDSKLRDEFDRLFNSLYKHPEHYKKVVTLLGGKRIGYTRKEIAEKTGIPYGGGLTKILKALEASDFILPYKPFGGKAEDLRYKLTDPFLLFYLHFMEDAKVLGDGYWRRFENTPALTAWRGLAFENVCFNHIPEIKKALGISGVYTEVSAWLKRGTAARRGAQIDMLIDRDDRIINLCEMKFSTAAFSLDKEAEEKLRDKQQAFYEQTRTRKAVHLTLITPYGLIRNRYSSLFQNVITAEDLMMD